MNSSRFWDIIYMILKGWSMSDFRTITGHHCCFMLHFAKDKHLINVQFMSLFHFFPVYANGGHDLPSLNSSGPNSITEEPPPELPLLPPAFLPIMQPAPPPMMPYPAVGRPAPLGRQSPPHGGRGRRESPSPSPPSYGDNR